MFAKRDLPVTNWATRKLRSGLCPSVVAHRGYEVGRSAGFALGHGRL